MEEEEEEEEDEEGGGQVSHRFHPQMRHPPPVLSATMVGKMRP